MSNKRNTNLIFLFISIIVLNKTVIILIHISQSIDKKEIKLRVSQWQGCFGYDWKVDMKQ